MRLTPRLPPIEMKYYQAPSNSTTALMMRMSVSASVSFQFKLPLREKRNHEAPVLAGYVTKTQYQLTTL